MRKLCFMLWLSFLLGSTLAACRHHSSAGVRETPVLLWHSWNEEETAVLEQVLEDFSSIYPDFSVVQQALPPDRLLERFKTQAASGLGPDLLLLSTTIPPELTIPLPSNSAASTLPSPPVTVPPALGRMMPGISTG